MVGSRSARAPSPAPLHLRDRLQRAGRLDGAVIGARLGLDGELIAPAERVLTQNEQLPYLATLIVPATRPARGSSLAQTHPATTQSQPAATQTHPPTPRPRPPTGTM